MMTYSVQTDLSPQEVYSRAEQYFGAGSLWLLRSEGDAEGVRFEGAGGHVVVKAKALRRKTKVRLESAEWDDEADLFRNYLA